MFERANLCGFLIVKVKTGIIGSCQFCHSPPLKMKKKYIAAWPHDIFLLKNNSNLTMYIFVKSQTLKLGANTQLTKVLTRANYQNYDARSRIKTQLKHLLDKHETPLDFLQTSTILCAYEKYCILLIIVK